MRTILDLGKIDYNRSGRKNCRVTIEMTLEDGRLSLVGNIWNPRETDIYSGGQCYKTIAEYFPRNKKVQRLIEIWKRWHLNDMKAGDPEQEAYLRDHESEYETLQEQSETYVDWYTWACKVLASAGLHPHNGYAYGSAWLKEELPGYVLCELIKIFSPKREVA